MRAYQGTSALATIAFVIALGVAPGAATGRQAESAPADASALVTDPRDGKQYPVVTIAGMTWMARNLDHAVEGSVCPRDDSKACETEGRLYPWAAAVTACPAGWHLSTEDEWQRLERALGMSSEDVLRDRLRGPGLGDLLKQGGSTGLNFPLAGWRRPDGTFRVGNGNDRAAAIWTSTRVDDAAWHRDLSSARTGIWRSPVPLAYSLSVRCVTGSLAGSLASSATPQAHGAMYHFPRWSPDGTSILVSAVLDGDSELYLLFPDGRSPRKLTDNAASDDAARWVDGGRRIRFVTDRRGRSETFEMGIDGSAPRAVDADNNNITSTSADGRIDLRDGQGVIVAVDRAGNTRRPLTRGLWAEQGSFSPDGQRIVFEQRATTDPHRVELSNVVVAQADGREPAIVSAGTDPSWSPDGARLLFKVWDGALQRLFVTTARPDGSDVRRLGEGVHPQWSPDGRQIVFMRDVGDDVHIWLMAHDGQGQRCLTCQPTQ